MRIEENVATTKSGKQKFEIRVTCECGFSTKGSNTFSMEHLRKWAAGMVDWHNKQEHAGKAL